MTGKQIKGTEVEETERLRANSVRPEAATTNTTLVANERAGARHQILRGHEGSKCSPLIQAYW